MKLTKAQLAQGQWLLEFLLEVECPGGRDLGHRAGRERPKTRTPRLFEHETRAVRDTIRLLAQLAEEST
jgi:hypothetical protein